MLYYYIIKWIEIIYFYNYRSYTNCAYIIIIIVVVEIKMYASRKFFLKCRQLFIFEIFKCGFFDINTLFSTDRANCLFL